MSVKVRIPTPLRGLTRDQDVVDESKGPTGGAHLPSIHPEVRDAVTPRSLAVDIETERYRASGPNAAGG